MGKLVLGYWDCEYCNTKSIPGDKRNCPHCGHPRDDNVTFYMNPKSITYLEESQVKKVNKNPDWICPFCNCLNNDSNNSCESCGALRTSDNKNYHENQLKKKSHQEKLSHNDSDSFDNFSSHSDSSISSSSLTSFEEETSTIAKKQISWKSLLLVFIAVLSIIGILYLALPKTKLVYVSNLTWEYNIQVEELKTFEENGWDLPAGASLKTSRLELHHYQNVLDHYETRTRTVQKQRISGYETYVSGYRDLGNGYFEEITSQRPIYETYLENETYQEPIYRQEPVYQTKYYYEINRWVYEYDVTTQGEGKDPYWGDVTLNNNERIATQTESYKVIGITSKEKSINFFISKTDFQKIQLGNSYLFDIRFGIGTLKE